MPIFRQNINMCYIAEKICCQIKLVKTFTTLKVLDLFNAIQSEIQIFETLHSTDIFDFKNQIVLKKLLIQVLKIIIESRALRKGESLRKMSDD